MEVLQITTFFIMCLINVIAIISEYVFRRWNDAINLFTVYDKCMDSSGKYSYLVLLRFDPNKKYHFRKRTATIALDFSEPNTSHITRVTIPQEVLNNMSFINLEESLARMRFIRMNAMPDIGHIRVNHNQTSGFIFIYSIEIQDFQQKTSYYAQVNQEIYCEGPIEGTKQTFPCLTRDNISVNMSTVPQHILYNEYVYFVYLAFNIVFLVPVLAVYILDIENPETWKGMGIGLLASTMAWILSSVCLLYYRFDIKVKYSLNQKSRKWVCIRNGFLAFICVSGLVMGAFTTYLVYWQINKAKNRNQNYNTLYHYFYYTWTMGWGILFLIMFACYAISLLSSKPTVNP